MNIFEALYSIDRFNYIEEGRKAIENLSLLNTSIDNIKLPDIEKINEVIKQTSEIIAVFQQIDLIKISDVVVSLPKNVQKAADIWAEYGWVPYLPTSNIKDLINFNYPKSQEEADEIMMQKLDNNGIKVLFDTLNKQVKSHSHNINSFEEAVKSYNNGIYSGCSLLIFAIIDSCFLVGQPVPTPTKENKNPKRQLASSAIKVAIDCNKSKIAVFAYTVKRIIESRFKYGNDFDSSKENGVNRNFLSHGMNTYIPSQKDCLQLFVLLYNIYVSFDGKFYSWTSNNENAATASNRAGRNCCSTQETH